ncbi:PadR family transcriptional regulator [Streptomyces sp. SID13031]|uniref:PadR family transcriptional regulator n=1 Tax=Streptomyces sp. SID13031 TaxID=2706046 RepID=UPI0013CD1BF9|nr:PadR family transcriptional regulator [Streptomyces sp. SID13031]NEA34502.1 PadR family transcriptional regulator [Streptomyces sp. SID13031]
MTPLAIAVLALLVERRMHAYEMYQVLLQRRNDRLLKVKPGSLYHTVERLAGQELVRATGTERAGNRPERTTYEITDAGKSALEKRVQSGIETYTYEYPLFPVVLSEAHNLETGDVVTRLSRRLGEIDLLVGELDAAIAEVTTRRVPEPFWLAADFNRTVLVAERDWLTTLLQRIESKDLSWHHRKSK